MSKTETSPTETFVSVRTKTGKDIHEGWANGTTTRCGVSLKSEGRDWEVYEPVTCERCLGATR